MIEMRWVEREVIPKGIVGVIPKENILQYRQKLISGSWSCIPPTNAPTEWSEWIDVPTVKEG